LFFLSFLVCDVSVSLSRYISAYLHSLTPHDMSLTTTPSSINPQSTQHSHLLVTIQVPASATPGATALHGY
jgi:hypothetical protein